VAGSVTIVHDVRILDEYRTVALRPKFAFDVEEIESVLAFIHHAGWSAVCTPLVRPLPDVADGLFLEAALASGADTALITGNIRQFPPDLRQGVPVCTPRDWLDWWRSHSEVTPGGG
jgi:predicted nucleic acid-binding protein